MNLDKFNLNLFVALDAVLHAGSLTEAARRLHLTQPAVSIALKKLRETYGDEIVLYGTGAPVLTPLGEALRPRVKALIQAAKDAMKVCPSFDPATSSHAFHLVVPAILELFFLPSVYVGMAGTAPGVRLSTEAFNFSSIASVLNNGNDLAVIPDVFADPAYSQEPLFDECFKCVVWEGNDEVGTFITEDQFFRLGHVEINHLNVPPVARSPTTLRRINQERRVVLQASSYAALPHLVVGTKLVAVTLSRYAQWCAERLPLRVLPFPFDVPATRYVAQWQPYRDGDPALLWLRDRLQSGVQRLNAEAMASPPLLAQTPG